MTENLNYYGSTTLNQEFMIPSPGITFGGFTLSNSSFSYGNATFNIKSAVLRTRPAYLFMTVTRFDGGKCTGWAEFSNGSNTIRLDFDITELVQIRPTDKSELMRNIHTYRGNYNLIDTSLITDMSGIFKGFYFSVEDFKGIETWDVSNVTDMSFMFQGAEYFNNDISSWDVSNVTTMESMFSSCIAFNQNIDNWNVSSVTNMRYMFSRCTNFNQPLNSWNVSNVTDISGMFYNCTNFNQPLDNWTLTNLNSMIKAFYEARRFDQNIDNWNISENVVTRQAFYNCPTQPSWYSPSFTPATKQELIDNLDKYKGRLGFIDLSLIDDLSNLFETKTYWTNDDFNGIDTWDVNNVTKFSGMFKGCYNFNQNLSSWIVYQCNDFSYMFYGCSSFNQRLEWSIGVQYRREGYNLESMFEGCTSLNNYVSLFYTSSSTYFYKFLNMKKVFKDCISLDFYDFYDHWFYMLDTPVIEFDYMFENCVSLTKTPKIFSRFNMSTPYENRVSTVGMFKGCINISTVYVSLPKYSYNTKEMFYDCQNFNSSLDSELMLANTDMSYMFYNCKKFNRSLSNYDVSNVTDMSFTFYNCALFNQSLSTWNVGKVTNMQSMFDGCTLFNQSLSSWTVTAVTNLVRMFNEATSFNQNIDSWNVSRSVLMTSAFYNCPTQPNWYVQPFVPNNKQELINNLSSYKGRLYNIDTRLVDDLSYLFKGKETWTNSDFNGIEYWDISNVTNLEATFKGCTNFNQDISTWNSSNVTNMKSMFQGCTSFNINTLKLITSNVTDMSSMFQGCTSLNNPEYFGSDYQKIGYWITTNVENIDSMFEDCTNLNYQMNIFDTTSLTSFNNTFNNTAMTSMPWWYGLNIEKSVYLDSDTLVDFTQDVVNSLTFRLVSNSPDLTVKNYNKNSFLVRTTNTGKFTPNLVYETYGKSKIDVTSKAFNIDSTIDVKAGFVYNLDLTTLYNSPTFPLNLDINNITSTDPDVVISKTGTRTYDITVNAIGSHTLDIEIEGVHGTITANSTQLTQDVSINVKNSIVKEKDFNLDYPGYDVTSMTIVSNNAELEVNEVRGGVFNFKSLDVGTFTATLTLKGLTNTITVISESGISDVSFNYKATEKKNVNFIDEFGADIDYNDFSVSSGDANFIVNKIDEHTYDLIGLVSGTFTGEISLNNEVKTLTFTTTKLIPDESRNIKSNTNYSFDFNQIYPNSVINTSDFTCNNPDLIITKNANNIFNILSSNIGRFDCIININGDESNLTLNSTKLIDDRIISIHNKFYKLNFNTMYPNANLTGLKVVTSSNIDKIQLTNISNGIYELSFLEKGTYELTITLGKMTSIFTLKVFFIDSSNPEIYQYPTSFIDELIKPQLFDPNLYIYQYNQYGEIEWVSKFFSYMNNKMKKYLDYIYLWFALKTNQQLDRSKMDYINDEKYYYYINFLEKYFDGINKAFGSSSAITFWDNQGSEWNDNKTRWDDTIKTSDLSVNKFKCILRYIKDISNKTFNLNRFIQFCNEFVNCDVTDPADKIELFVDETSFENPSSIVIYSPVISDNTNILLSMVTSSYKYLMPMNEITIRQKIKSKSKSSRSRTKKDK